MLIQTKSTVTAPYVLLVEDDMLVHKIHRKKLETLGFTVDSAMNGKDALAALNGKYDLILLDWGLPGMSGLDVSKQIREYELQNQLPRVTIIMITAYAQNIENDQACINAGIDHVITKPIIDNDTWKSFLNLIKK